MNTFFALMAEYGTAHIPVEKCAGLFGMSPKKACEAAGKQQLPVPTFRLGSQKKPMARRCPQASRTPRQSEVAS